MLKEYMLILGYNEEDINKFIKIYLTDDYKEEDLYNRMNDIHTFFALLGFSNEDILKIGKVIRIYINMRLLE